MRTFKEGLKKQDTYEKIQQDVQWSPEQNSCKDLPGSYQKVARKGMGLYSSESEIRQTIKGRLNHENTNTNFNINNRLQSI